MTKITHIFHPIVRALQLSSTIRFQTKFTLRRIYITVIGIGHPSFESVSKSQGHRRFRDPYQILKDSVGFSLASIFDTAVFMIAPNLWFTDYDFSLKCQWIGPMMFTTVNFNRNHSHSQNLRPKIFNRYRHKIKWTNSSYGQCGFLPQ